MSEPWQRTGERPAFEGLDDPTKGEVLLRVDVLTGWIGSTEQTEDTQKTAKNPSSESVTLFEELRHAEKVDEAQTEFAYCYWRPSAFDKARVTAKGSRSPRRL